MKTHYEEGKASHSGLVKVRQLFYFSLFILELAKESSKKTTGFLKNKGLTERSMVEERI